MTYIWVEDGSSALNVDLVRKGLVPGGAMHDMVDNAEGLLRLVQNNPMFASARAQMARERAEAPDDRAERLVPEALHQSLLARISKAEREARAAKLGIWSDDMKEEREVEGIP